MYGVEEDKFNVEMYVHIGNKNTHGKKRIRNQKHYRITAKWLCSRSSHPALNELLIFTNEVIDFDAFPEYLSFDIEEFNF